MEMQNRLVNCMLFCLRGKLSVLIFCMLPMYCFAQPLRYPPIQEDKKYPDFGYYYPMYIADRMPFIDAYIDGIKLSEDSLHGRFLVDYGSDTTVIDLFGFPGIGLDTSKNHSYSILFKDAPGKNRLARSGPHNPPFCYVQDLGGYKANGIREGGIVGTDILSQIILTLDYKHSRFYIATDRVNQCTPTKMSSLGFTAASTKGSFSNDKSTLILQSVSSVNQQNNNPHITICIGNGRDSAQALGSIDPGYDDRIYLEQDYNVYYTHIVNINELYYQHLKDKKIAIEIDRNNYALLSNRTEFPDTLFRCNFAKKYEFSIISREGKSVFPYSTDSINVFLKISGGGQSAGGITTLRIPAAQFGGSFLLDFDIVTFDPFNSLVWFKKRE